MSNTSDRKREFKVSPATWAQYRHAVAASNLINRRYPRTVRFHKSMDRALRPKYVAALSLCGIAIEHHSAHLTLVKQRMWTSAYALVRPIFDAVLRAAWAFCVATPQAISRFAQGTDPGPVAILKALKAVRPDLYEMLEPMKRQGWDVMSAYVHSGPHQVFEWYEDDRISPRHPEEGLVEILKLTTHLALLAFAMMCEISGVEDEVITGWLNDFYASESAESAES